MKRSGDGLFLVVGPLLSTYVFFSQPARLHTHHRRQSHQLTAVLWVVRLSCHPHKDYIELTRRILFVLSPHHNLSIPRELHSDDVWSNEECAYRTRKSVFVLYIQLLKTESLAEPVLLTFGPPGSLRSFPE